MASVPLFTGLIIDEYDQPVGTATIGSEPCYVVNDEGFLRHIPSKPIDLEVLQTIGGQISGNEELIADQAAKMLGQDDLFSHAILENQLKNIDKQYEQMIEMGFPEETRTYLGLLGFKVVINIHGEIIKIEQPSAPPADGEDEE